MPREPQQIWHGDSIQLCERFKPASIGTVITDPPFGVDNQSNQAVTEHGKEYARKIANDESPEVAIKVFKSVFKVLESKFKPDANLYVFTSYQVLSDWLVMTDDFLGGMGFKRKAILIWKKEGPGMGDTECPWGMGCEFILFFQRGRPEKIGQRRNPVIELSQVRPNQLIHPHEKPELLLELLMKQVTREGDFVLDPFGGSGSLARAARNIKRTAVCIELDKKNYELSKKKFDTAAEGFDF